MKFYLFFFISLVSFLLSPLAVSFSAQALEFQSYVDKTEVGLNEPFTLSLEFQSSEDSVHDLNIEASDIFNLKDFTFLNQSQSQKSSLSIINGKREFVQALIKSYRLQPKALGVFTIAPIKVTAGKQVFQTSAFEIKVLANKKLSPQTNPFSVFPNPFKFPPSGFDFPDLFKQVKGDFKLVLELSKKILYKSEPLKADWLLLSTSKMPRYESGPVPPPKGFWKEEVKNIKPLVDSKAIGDTLYRKQTIGRLWLFPLKTGELKVSSHSIEVFSGFSLQNQVLSTPERSVQVKELPLRGRDLSFTGAVGSFQVDFSIPRRDLTLNEPFFFKIAFKGSGHPRFIQLPYLALGADFKAYEPVQKSSFSSEGIGAKEFEILITPKKEGALIFPEITLSTFDPKAKKYIYHKSPEFKLSVKKDFSSVSGQSSQTFFDTASKKENSSQSDFSSFSWSSFLSSKILLNFFKLLVLIFCFSILFIAGKKIFLKKSHSLNKKIKNKIKEIEKKLNQSATWQSACIEMIHLLKFILDSFQAGSPSSHWRQTLENLPPSLNTKYAEELEPLFKELEQLSFSPQKKDAKAFQQSKALFKKIKAFRKEISSQL